MKAKLIRGKSIDLARVCGLLIAVIILSVSSFGLAGCAGIAGAGSPPPGGGTSLSITNPGVTSSTTTSLTVAWQTNLPATSQVEFGTTTGYGVQTALDTSKVTSHQQGVTSLQPGTKYHYRVHSNDANNNAAVSADMTATTTTPDTTPPTVSITSPAANTTLSGAVSVTATASDNVGVAGVQFKVDGANTGAELTAAPYTYTLNTTTLSNGNHILTAAARDAAGNTTTSAGVAVKVDNTTPDTTVPTVSISAPASGATVSGTVTVSANATDNVGVASVQFQLDSANVGSLDTTSPYSYSWSTTTASNGTHTLRAIAKDAAGNSTTSASVTVTVSNTTPDTTAPTVSISAPASGATVSGTVAVSADATDNVGVASVQFQLDSANVGSLDTTSPYSYSWSTTTASNGTHTLRAIAKDAAGNSTTSASVTVTVSNTTPDTTAPTVSISAPASGATVSGTVTVSANATDNVGVANVQFQLDSANVGSLDTTSPYSYSWSTTTASNGTHTLRAIAKDAAGNSTTSAAVTVTVNSTDATPPSAPSGLTALAASSSQINLTWTASTDNVGVTGYKVYRSGSQIGTSATTSYSDTGLAASTFYSYTVAAYDAAGNTSTQSASASTTTLASSGGGIPSALGWYGIPNTNISRLAPSYPEIQGAEGQRAVVSEWGSAWADTKRNRYILSGGGHNAYYGNEVYMIDLNANPITASLAKDASHGSNFSNSGCPDAYPDGNPNSQHDLDGLEYLPTQDVYFFYGGGLTPCGSFTSHYWKLSPSWTWTQYPLPGTAPTPGSDGSSSLIAYDRVNDLLYDLQPNAVGSVFWSYSGATNTWTDLNDRTGACESPSYNHTSVIDPVRRLYFCIGAGSAWKISLNSPYAATSLSMTSCGGVKAATGPGLAYYDPDGTIVAWIGGNSVYRYNPDTDSCTTTTYSGGPPAASSPDGGGQQAEGTYKRFRYFPGLGVFVVANDVAQNAYALRLTASSGGGGGSSGPAISNISTTAVTTSSATITWTTDVEATSQVEYGTTTAYGTLTTLNASLVTSHTGALTGLTTNTLYHCRVHSKNSSGVESISGDYAFQTNNTTDTTAPTVSISSPANGATVSGTVTVSASASDNVGVTSVQFLSDGTALGAPVTSAPFGISWNTTAASNGAHALTAQARDLAGNVGTSTAVTVTVSNSSSSADANFAARRSSPGVIASRGWDSTTEFAAQPDATKNGFQYATSCPTWPTPCIQQDTSVYLSGGSSARWDIHGNTSEDGEGYWLETFNQTFAQNSTFYIQFAFRADTNWVMTDWTQTSSTGETSPKIMIIHGVSSNGQPQTCDNVQFVYRNEHGWALPDMYSACGASNAYTNPDGSTYDESGSSLYQQGFTAPAPFTGYDCPYHSGSMPTGNCFFFQADQWYTIYIKLHIGTWGQPNSTVEAWVAPYGQQLKKMVNVMNYTENSSSIPGFSAVTLTQYMTGKLASASHPTAHAWYDELIISTQAIPAPAGQTP